MSILIKSCKSQCVPYSNTQNFEIFRYKLRNVASNLPAPLVIARTTHPERHIPKAGHFVSHLARWLTLPCKLQQLSSAKHLCFTTSTSTSPLPNQQPTQLTRLSSYSGLGLDLAIWIWPLL